MVLRGATPRLSVDPNGSLTDSQLVDRAGDDTRGSGAAIRRHRSNVDVKITGEVDGE